MRDSINGISESFFFPPSCPVVGSDSNAGSGSGMLACAVLLWGEWKGKGSRLILKKKKLRGGSESGY